MPNADDYLEESQVQDIIVRLVSNFIKVMEEREKVAAYD